MHSLRRVHARTLSGGEAQRIQLATALGGSLTASLYVLDEPSIGLHAADLERLLRVLEAIRDQGNTVVVVEHALALIEAADGGASSPEFMRKVRASKKELAGIYWDSIGSEPAAQLLALKTLNLLLARRDFFDRAQRAIASPFGLVVEPSNGCNLGCPGCVHSANAKQRKVFDWSPGMVKADLMRDFLSRKVTTPSVAAR